MPMTPIPPLDRTSPTFKNDLDQLFSTRIPLFTQEANAMEAGMSAFAAGGAYAIPFVGWGDLATVAAGNGRLFIAGDDQTQSTTVYFTGRDSRNKNVRPMFDDVFSSTSSAKAYLTITVLGDTSRWITYRVNSWAYGAVGVAGVTYVASSGASPIPANEGLIMQITRTGDKGDQGPAATIAGAKFSERFAQGMGGGAAAANTVYTRSLNTTEYNDIGAVLSNGKVILQPGRYIVSISAPANSTNRHRAYISNETDGNSVPGANAYATGSGQSNATASALFSFGSAKTISIRHYIDTSNASTSALGLPINRVGEPEIYSEMIITKVG